MNARNKTKVIARIDACGGFGVRYEYKTGESVGTSSPKQRQKRHHKNDENEQKREWVEKKEMVKKKKVCKTE